MHEALAGVDLGGEDVLVGLMGLGDVAGAADHGRYAQGLAEDAGLGAVDHAAHGVGSRPASRQCFRLVVALRREGRRRGAQHRADRRRRMLCLHPRQQFLFQPFDGAIAERLDRQAWQLAIAPQDLALARQDVARRAAHDGTDIEGRRRRHELALLRRLGVELVLHRVEVMDELAGEMDGADPEMGHRGVRLEAGEPGDVDLRALVGVDHGHHGRLADDDGTRPGHFACHAGGQPVGADAADLLVIGEREVNRLLELGLLELRQHGEADGIERLHVAGAATMVFAVLQGERPGIGVPWLAIDRHHVGVSAQHDAVLYVGPDGGEEIGLRAVLARHQLGNDAVFAKVLLYVLDQRQIGIARGGVERHETAQHFDRADDLPCHDAP